MTKPPQDPPINDSPCPRCGWPMKGWISRKCSNANCPEPAVFEVGGMYKTWATLQSICYVLDHDRYSPDERDLLLARILEILGDDMEMTRSQRERLDDVVSYFNMMRGET